MISKIPSQPAACQLEAYQLFVGALPRIHTTEGLITAATAVSLHALDDVDPRRVADKISALAADVRSRVRSPRTSPLLAHLHEVLFVEQRFAGNTDHYYVALNSYLPVVLDTRRGLPIILSLIYKAVGERLGLEIEGVNAPGHFMVRVRSDEGWMIVDPFYGGASLSRSEAFQRLDHTVGKPVPREDQWLASASHPQWLARILANLVALFAAEGRQDDLAAMSELHHVLEVACGSG